MSHVWNRSAIIDDIYTTYSMPQIPEDLNDFPCVVMALKSEAIIAINPKRGYLLLRNGIKTEIQPLRELCDKYIGSGLWEEFGWEKEFVKGLVKREIRPYVPGVLEFAMVEQARSEGRKDIRRIEDLVPLDKNGLPVINWTFNPEFARKYYPESARKSFDENEEMQWELIHIREREENHYKDYVPVHPFGID